MHACSAFIDMWRPLELTKKKIFSISHGACSITYIKTLKFYFFYHSIGLRAQLGFYKFDDVFVTSRDVIFAIVQLFGTVAVIPRLLETAKV